MVVNDKVRAACRIVEDGTKQGKKGLPFPNPEYIHAEEGDEGVVEYVSGAGIPTVRFNRTGTATVVAPEEVDYVPM
jgi:hypothetical protein